MLTQAQQPKRIDDTVSPGDTIAAATGLIYTVHRTAASPTAGLCAVCRVPASGYPGGYREIHVPLATATLISRAAEKS
jgi:hypothetical protein